MISEQASIVCGQIGAAVAFADSEKDLRKEVEKAIGFGKRRRPARYPGQMTRRARHDRRLRPFPNCQLFLSELGIEHVIDAIAEQIDAQHEQ